MTLRQDKALVEITNLTCLRGGRLLFEGLSLAIQPGEALVLEGPNGIGKSSLLRMVAGLLRPASGALNVQGAMALSDENLALDRDQPLGRALSFWARMDGAQDADVAAALDNLALGGLCEGPVRMLSTGQRRRAGLARVLASGAPVWLLDEPLNGLDAASVQTLSGIMDRHLAEGGLIMAASHLPLSLPAVRLRTFALQSGTAL